jgi:serine/threonine protein kinase/uncharacterized protein HemY
MGVVYRAHDTLLKRDVAIKMVPVSALGTDGQTRLLQEARAAASLNHPNIVSVYDVIEIAPEAGSAASLFVVMELVKGQTLKNWQLESLDEFLSISLQISAALEQAHAAGVIHRDLKPENIIVAFTDDKTTDEDGSTSKYVQVKLMDFGLARIDKATQLTQEGTLLGTLLYMAPEIIMDQSASEQSDIYSLGIVLYELATGRLPFAAESPAAILSSHLHGSVEPAGNYNQELPPAVDSLILRMLSKAPDDRPANVVQVRRTLQSISREAVLDPAGSSPSSVLKGITRGNLVGRERELLEATSLWQKALAGEGSVLLISGEPGIGKTRLAEELIAHSQVTGAQLLSGGCYEFEATTPYLPMAEAIKDWVHIQSEETLRNLLGDAMAELARLAPEIVSILGDVPPSPPLSPNEERIRLFDNIARFLESLASRRGLLVFIDDLHWADQGTLALLSYLTRRLSRQRLLILATYREVELDRAHPLAAALVAWNRERLVTRIGLKRLSVENTNMLIATLLGQSSVSDEFAEAIHQETDGNPFFVEEVIKELIERGRVYRIGGHWERDEMAELAIPQSIKEAIGRRLDRLSSTCIGILQTAAGIGKNFDYEVLVSVVTVDEDDLLDALDEADAAQLIRPATGEVYIFTHDKIREVLYTELNPIRRRRLHRRIGNALEQLFSSDLGSRAQELAYHYIESGELDKGLRYSLAAAKRAEGLFAQDEALKFYSDARECAEVLNEPDTVLEINVALADLYALGGQNRLAIEYYERALTSTKSGKAHAALLAKIGAVHATTGDERGLEPLRKAISELNQDESRLELATATIALGRFHHLHAEYTDAIEHYELARTLAEPLDDPSTLTTVYSYLAGSYQQLTDFERSLYWARKTIALGERKNYPFAIASGNEFLAEDYASIGRWTDSLEAADRDSHYGNQSGSQSRVAWADFSRGMALNGLGSLETAAAAFRASVDLAEQIGEMRLDKLALVYLGSVFTDLGDHENARVVSIQAINEMDESSEKQAQAHGYGSLGYFYLQRGEWTFAVSNYEKAIAIVAGTENNLIMLLHMAEYAESLLGMGRTEEALIHAQTNLALAEKAQSICRIGVTYKVLGQILSAQKKHEDASKYFARSIEILEETKTQLLLGRAYLQRGVMRKAAAILLDARRDFSKAASVFKELGAAYDLERANDLLSTIHVP